MPWAEDKGGPVTRVGCLAHIPGRYGIATRTTMTENADSIEVASALSFRGKRRQRMGRRPANAESSTVYKRWLHRRSGYDDRSPHEGSPDMPRFRDPLLHPRAGQAPLRIPPLAPAEELLRRPGRPGLDHGIVPHYITSNGWIADAYAKVVLGWLRDCTGTVREPSSFAPLDLRHPVYIVELGCGSGRFGFHFFNRLLDLLEPLVAEPRAGPLCADRLHGKKSRAVCAIIPCSSRGSRRGSSTSRASTRRSLERSGSNGPGWCSPPRRCAIRWW